MQINPGKKIQVLLERGRNILLSTAEHGVTQQDDGRNGEKQLKNHSASVQPLQFLSESEGHTEGSTGTSTGLRETLPGRKLTSSPSISFKVDRSTSLV